MEMFTKCGRCGTLVRPCDAKETAGGTRMRFWAAATTCTVDTDGGMALDFGGATVLCPDCMEQLKEWLASEPEEPQGQEEAGQSSDGDTTKRLASDLADAVANMGDTFDTFTNVEELGRYRRQLACGYFGHGGYTGCLDREVSTYHDECPAYSSADGTPESCWAAMCDDIARRCMASGIDLGDGEYAKW